MISCGTNQNNISESGPENNRKRYFFALDGWRFWAALIIVLHHAIQMPYFVQNTDFSCWSYTASATTNRKYLGGNVHGGFTTGNWLYKDGHVETKNFRPSLITGSNNNYFMGR